VGGSNLSGSRVVSRISGRAGIRIFRRVRRFHAAQNGEKILLAK
jgi:hypothetical protein